MKRKCAAIETAKPKRHGSRVLAARRIGVSFDEYCRRREDGENYCGHCKAWAKGGYGGRCVECHRQQERDAARRKRAAAGVIVKPRKPRTPKPEPVEPLTPERLAEQRARHNKRVRTAEIHGATVLPPDWVGLF